MIFVLIQDTSDECSVVAAVGYMASCMKEFISGLLL